MLNSNISIDEDAQLFESVTAPGAHILLGYDDAQSFETIKKSQCHCTKCS